MELKEPSAKYLVRPGYRQTEVGVIPEDWEVLKVGELSRLINGRGFKPYEWQLRGLPIIRIQNLNGSSDFNYYSGPYDRKIEVPPGQLLFAWSGSRGTSFGPHVWSGELGLLNYHTWKVEVCEDKVLPKYFFYVLKDLTAFIESEAHGASALVHTQKWQMEGFQTAVAPDQREQQAIADALGDADALIESLEHLLAKQRLLRQATMQALLTGERRLPGFEGAWKTVPMGELFDFGGGFTASRDQLGTEGVCYLHYGDIHTSDKTFIDVRAELDAIPKLIVPLGRVQGVLLRHGDVVFVDASEDEDGTSNHVVIENPDGIPFIAGLHTITARSRTDVLDIGYKRYCFQTAEVKEQFRYFAVGTKVSGVSKGNIGKITVRVPTLAEQTAIATVLSDLDAEIAALEARIAKARLVKQGMMQELLTGRIRLV
jgi:type I restriction enzyme, S subunit